MHYRQITVASAAAVVVVVVVVVVAFVMNKIVSLELKASTYACKLLVVKPFFLSADDIFSFQTLKL